MSELVAFGFTNREIARQLGISEQAVKNHLHALYQLIDPADGMGNQSRVLVALDYWRNHGS